MQSSRKTLTPSEHNFLKWLIPLIILAAVLIISLHLSEEKDFLTLLKKANPFWIALGLVLQAGTYFCQSYIWREGLKLHGHNLRLYKLFGLSLAQLFINQAIPSMSVSGAFFFSRALRQSEVPRQDVYGTLGLTFMSYFEAYALAALLAVIMLYRHHIIHHKLASFLGLTIIVFCFLFFLVAKRSKSFVPKIYRGFHLSKYKITQRLMHLALEMDFEKLPFPVISKAISLQLMIFILDFLTLWAMVRSLGPRIEPGHIFLSYMMAYFTRTIGLLPGGVGIFEAASIAGLHQAGVTIGASVAATLLYRGLSFWLPMIPGLVLAQRIFRHSKTNSK